MKFTVFIFSVFILYWLFKLLFPEIRNYYIMKLFIFLYGREYVFEYIKKRDCYNQKEIKRCVHKFIKNNVSLEFEIKDDVLYISREHCNFIYIEELDNFIKYVKNEYDKDYSIVLF